MEDGKQNAANTHEKSGPHKHDATKTERLPWTLREAGLSLRRELTGLWVQL